MRLMHVTFHFEYAGAIERILDRHQVTDFVRYPMVEGRDRDGKHYGDQVYPGSMVAIQALLHPEQADALLDDLRRFRDQKPAHAHLRAVVLAADRVL